MGIKICEEEHFSTVQLVVNVYMTPIFCLVGFIENILMIVILKKNKRSGKTTTFMLQMIAVADICYLFSSLFVLTLDTIAEKMEVGHKYVKPTVWPYLEPYVWPVASVFQTATVFLVVLMTGDRFMAVCYPMKAMRYSNLSVIKRLTVAIWIGSCFYNLPRFFEQKIVIGVNKTTADDWISSNADYIIIYQNALFFVIRFAIPFALLIVFNVGILRAIKKSMSFREQMTVKSESRNSSVSNGHSMNPSLHPNDSDNINNNSKAPVARTISANSTTSNGRESRKASKEKAATNHHTLTLVIAVLVYIVCEIPDKVFRILKAIYISTDDVIELRILGDLNVISNFLLSINSMTNFLVYCLMVKWFRRALVDLLLCRKQSSYREGQSSTRYRNDESSVAVSKTASINSISVNM